MTDHSENRRILFRTAYVKGNAIMETTMNLFEWTAPVSWNVLFDMAVTLKKDLLFGKSKKKNHEM